MAYNMKHIYLRRIILFNSYSKYISFAFFSNNKIFENNKNERRGKKKKKIDGD